MRRKKTKANTHSSYCWAIYYMGKQNYIAYCRENYYSNCTEKVKRISFKGPVVVSELAPEDIRH